MLLLFIDRMQLIPLLKVHDNSIPYNTCYLTMSSYMFLCGRFSLCLRLVAFGQTFKDNWRKYTWSRKFWRRYIDCVFYYFSSKMNMFNLIKLTCLLNSFYSLFNSYHEKIWRYIDCVFYYFSLKCHQWICSI